MQSCAPVGHWRLLPVGHWRSLPVGHWRSLREHGTSRPLEVAAGAWHQSATRGRCGSCEAVGRCGSCTCQTPCASDLAYAAESFIELFLSNGSCLCEVRSLTSRLRWWRDGSSIPPLFSALSRRLGKTLRMAATRKRHWPRFASREKKERTQSGCLFWVLVLTASSRESSTQRTSLRVVPSLPFVVSV